MRPLISKGGRSRMNAGPTTYDFFFKKMHFFILYTILWGSWEMKVLKKRCVRKLAE